MGVMQKIEHLVSGDAPKQATPATPLGLTTFNHFGWEEAAADVTSAGLLAERPTGRPARRPPHRTPCTPARMP